MTSRSQLCNVLVLGKRVRAKGTCRSSKAGSGTTKDGQCDWDVVAEDGGGRSYSQTCGQSPDPFQPFQTLQEFRVWSKRQGTLLESFQKETP